jgi:hypothetical protein
VPELQNGNQNFQHPAQIRTDVNILGVPALLRRVV